MKNFIERNKKRTAKEWFSIGCGAIATGAMIYAIIIVTANAGHLTSL